MRSGALAFLLLASLLSGCSGSDDGPELKDQPTPDRAGEPGATGVGPTAKAAPAGQWRSEGFDGDFTTTVIVDIGSFVAGAPDVVTVPPGASFAWFNGTVSTPVPDGLTVRLDGPGCGTDCSVQVDVEEGAFSFGGYGPAPGDWAIRFFAQSAVQSGSYHIDVNAFVQ